NLGTGVTLPSGGFGGRGGGGGRGGFGAATDSAGGGALATRMGLHGEPVVIVGSDNKTLYLSGTRPPGASWNTQAPGPWVDKVDFETRQRSRVFDSPADAFEEFVTALDDDYGEYIYTKESPTVIADAWLHAKNGADKQITHAVDVGPEVSL